MHAGDGGAMHHIKVSTGAAAEIAVKVAAGTGGELTSCAVQCTEFVILPDESHRIHQKLLREVCFGAAKSRGAKVLEYVPAAICKFHGVAALRTAIGQNIDGISIARCRFAEEMCAGCLRTEEIGCQTFALIPVGCADDHFDILHGFSLLLEVRMFLKLSLLNYNW